MTMMVFVCLRSGLLLLLKLLEHPMVSCGCPGLSLPCLPVSLGALPASPPVAPRPTTDLDHPNTAPHHNQRPSTIF